MAQPQKAPDRPVDETRDWRALAGRLAALGSIAGETAHRFNNLRAVIEGTLDLIAAEPLGSRLAHRLERIREAASSAQALAESFVGAARVKRHGERRIDLAAWLADARPWLLDLAGEGRELAIEVPAEPVPFLCSPEELQPALAGLVLNAAASLGPAGSVRIRLEPRPPDDPDAILLSIADDGAGMAPGIAARAREPFFTTRAGAAGLGLTAAEAFATRNGGRLELSSSPGHGTVVLLWLKEAPEAAAS